MLDRKPLALFTLITAAGPALFQADPEVRL
jgi:hypothetical protein